MKFIIESMHEYTRHNQPCNRAYPIFITDVDSDGNKVRYGTWEIEIDSLDDLLMLQKDLNCQISIINHKTANRPCILLHEKY